MNSDRSTQLRDLLTTVIDARDTVTGLRATWEQTHAEVRDLGRRVSALENGDTPDAALPDTCPDFPPADLT